MTRMTDDPGAERADSEGATAERAAGQQLSALEGEEQVAAAARSQLYALFAHALSYPDDELCEWIREGGISSPLREQIHKAVPGFGDLESFDWDSLENPGGEDELAVEYTRLFDAGAQGPPCPLYGGLYGDARMKKMEEAVRFYNHFGLSLSEQQRELPDHLVTQLEFLHYLAYSEVEALQQNSDPGPFRRAQRDFIGRHPGRWIPQLREKLVKQQALPIFTVLFGVIGALLAAEGERLGAPKG